MNETLAEDNHNLKFIGKVGQFCPVIDGVGGGIMLREQGDKYYSVTGTKGYRWLESEVVRNEPDYRTIIDMKYYNSLVDEAVKSISQYCSDEFTFEWFVS